MSSFLNLMRFIAAHPLTRDRKLRAFGRICRWQLASRLHSEVVVPWIAGTRLKVSRGMTGATGNIYCGLHEFEDMAFLLHFLRPEDAFADVGANIGSYTILASGVSGALTIAFEPDPTTFAALSANVALNGLGERVSSNACALGREEREVNFTIGQDTVNRVTTDPAVLSRAVTMRTLDQALAGVRPSLIKLDVEGFEGEVLMGATQTLGRSELKAIITEDHSPVVTEVLRASGFVESDYDPFTRRLGFGPQKRQSHNGLFVRDCDFVQRRLTEAKPIRVLDCVL